MDTFLWVIGATFFVSLLGLSGGATLFLGKKKLQGLIYVLTAFAIGTLLGGAFLHLLPEAIAGESADAAMLFALSGFMAFFVLEAFMHLHMCPDEECHENPYSYLLLMGDALHNAIDGLVIAGSFLVGIPFGIVTTFLIMAHELPEELGIFAILVHGGFTREKALASSFLVQCTALIGGAAGYFVSSSVEGFVPALLAFAAGGFIYIAGSGLIPELHKEKEGDKLVSIALVGVGILFMWAVKALGGG